MAVIKNMMVRVGADVSSYLKGMRDSSVASMAFGKSSKEAQSAAKGYENPLKAAARASRAFKDEMAAATKANDAAKGRFSSVSQELKAAKDALKAVEIATEGLDAKKPLAQQRAAIEAEIEAINAKLGTLGLGMKNSKNGIVDLGDGSLLHMDDAKAQFAALVTQSDALAQKLTALDAVADQLGDAFQTATIKSALQDLTGQVDKLTVEYQDAQAVMGRAGEKAAQMGRASPVVAAISAALKAGATNAKVLGSKLANIPSMFTKISRSAKSGADNVSKLLTDIKRIGVVSLGLRVAGNLFGKLRSMVSSCLTSNMAYTETINTMNYQLTQSLAPTIGLVTDLLRRAMPVINGVASAISTVLVAAFGKAEAAAYAASAAMAAGGTYGFDQITKIDSSAVSDTSVQGSGMFSSIADTVVGEIEKIKSLLAAGDAAGIGRLLAGYFNSGIEKLGNLKLGEKLAAIINGGVQGALAFLREVDWSELAAFLKDNFVDLWNGIDWGVLEPVANWAGETFISALTEIVDLLTDLHDLLSGKITFADFLSDLSSVQITLIAIATAVSLIKAAEAGITIFGGLTELVTSGVIGKLGEVFKIAASGAGSLSEAINLVFGPGSVIAGISAVLAGGILAVTNFFQMFKEGFSWLKEALMVVGIALVAVGAIILGAPALVAAIVAGIVAAIATAVVLIKEHWTEIVAGFKAAWSAVSDFFVKLWDGIVSTFKNKVVNGIIGFINGWLSAVTSGLNAVIGLLNKISVTLPDWEIFGDMAGATFGINISPLKAPQINYLAEGGYVVRPTKANIGEGGYKEAVLPLERNTGWARTIAALINGERSSGGEPFTLQVFIGGKKVHEETINYINRKTETTGKCPIYV